MRPAAIAFDAAAPGFDRRFGEWLSVAAQRQAVRRALAAAFPVGGRIFEIGGGTGEDASWLAERGFDVFLTDAAPAMVELSANKLARFGSRAEVMPAEDIEQFAERHRATGGRPFDGAFSNFAPLNCVADLAPVGRGLAYLLKPGSAAMLVLFGTFSPAEMLVEWLRGRADQSFRRLGRGDVPVRIGGKDFVVRYHRARELQSAMQPWFRLVQRLGIGIFVPPSAAEPWISRHPRFLAALECLDRLACRPLVALGDHVLYHFERTDAQIS
ncbi:MAG TPA: methyltransferase domain-containing protein [Rhizomicrobium sp.]|jgi:SAM-dependent methyltransferase|nr:methyltransferase domain-containing protein [Rhizomicrobium sp.]